MAPAAARHGGPVEQRAQHTDEHALQEAGETVAGIVRPAVHLRRAREH